MNYELNAQIFQVLTNEALILNLLRFVHIFNTKLYKLRVK